MSQAALHSALPRGLESQQDLDDTTLEQNKLLCIFRLSDFGIEGGSPSPTHAPEILFAFSTDLCEQSSICGFPKLQLNIAKIFIASLDGCCSVQQVQLLTKKQHKGQTSQTLIQQVNRWSGTQTQSPQCSTTYIENGRNNLIDTYQGIHRPSQIRILYNEYNDDIKFVLYYYIQDDSLAQAKQTLHTNSS